MQRAWQTLSVSNYYPSYAICENGWANSRVRSVLGADDGDDAKTADLGVEMSNAKGIVLDLPRIRGSVLHRAHLELNNDDNPGSQQHCVRSET